MAILGRGHLAGPSGTEPSRGTVGKNALMKKGRPLQQVEVESWCLPFQGGPEWGSGTKSSGQRGRHLCLVVWGLEVGLSGSWTVTL